MDPEELDRVVRALMHRQVVAAGAADSRHHLPDRDSVIELCRRFLDLIFPGFFSKAHIFRGNVDSYTRQSLLELQELLQIQVLRAQRFSLRCRGQDEPSDLESDIDQRLSSFYGDLAEIAGVIATDVEAAFQNDPAAASREEIIAAYPGLEAIAVQRLAHGLYRYEIPLVPRMMTEVAHNSTGIDINPGAQIGHSFAIDHGTGIVIGETCRIGDHCMLYHGVTLGAFNPTMRDEAGELKRGQGNKRHPDLEDHVTVYSGATILGGETRIGHHSVIGGNVWLTHSVEPYSQVSIKDPEIAVRSRQKPQAADFSI